MNFFDLPLEVGVIIFNYLDIRSKINVYNICNQVREYLAPGWCHLKNVDLSRSTLATVKTLDETLFQNLGEYITDLNLSGIQDLTVENLKPHLNRFVNLKTLDITFTNIYLSDIADVCPQKVKNIGINFFKYRSNSKNESAAVKCRDIFKEKQFDTVHFVVFDSNVAGSPLTFLKGVPPINNLRITVSDNYRSIFEGDHQESNINDGKIEVNFNKITYLFRDCAVTHKMSEQLDGISKLNFNQLEYIFLMYLQDIVIYISPIFSNLFIGKCNGLKIEVVSDFPLNFMLDGNIIFKAWNKASTSFDEHFFSNLLIELKDYFPTYICMHSKTKIMITKCPSSWYCIDSCENFDKKVSNLPDKVTLTDFCRQNGILRRCRLPISLSKDSKALQHLTFLRINNIPLRKDFFTHLFNGCPKLTTLDIFIEKPGNTKIWGYNQSLSKSIHLAKFKNFMLTSEDIEYEIIFEILSNCISLENVHICDFVRTNRNHYVDAKNIVLCVEKCVNLYSLFIESDMAGEQLTMIMAPLREKAQRLEKDYLFVEVCEAYCGWNPFVDVFSPSPLHIQ